MHRLAWASFCQVAHQGGHASHEQLVLDMLQHLASGDKVAEAGRAGMREADAML